MINKKQIRFFAGYSGWEANQLENELKEDSWIVNNKIKDLSMLYSNNELWGKIMRRLEKKYAIWSNLPKNPNLN